MKLMVLSAIHNVTQDRGDIYRFFGWRMERVRDKFGVELMVVGSEGDESRSITELYGHHYVECDNRPLTQKWNAGMKAISEHKPTHVMILGSDDIVSDSLFEEYLFLLDSGQDIIAIKDLYFLGLNKTWMGTCGYWSGYKHGATLGVARVLPATLLDSIEWNPWYGTKNSGLDAMVTKRIRESKVPMKIKSMKLHDKHLVIDIKTQGNISSLSPFDIQARRYDELFYKHLPSDEATQIVQYCDNKITLHERTKDNSSPSPVE